MNDIPVCRRITNVIINEDKMTVNLDRDGTDQSILLLLLLSHQYNFILVGLTHDVHPRNASWR